jgi:hypothetical protein
MRTMLLIFHEASKDEAFITAWQNKEYADSGIIPQPPKQNAHKFQKAIFSAMYYGWKLNVPPSD